MNGKEATAAKKEKNLYGTKAKYSPNPLLAPPPPPVTEKKTETKLRRKESTKTKPAAEPQRKSVVARWFHNLVDSDEKKVTSGGETKKKKPTNRDADLFDLPEHGIILREQKIPPLTTDMPPLPGARTRAMTLANQTRDNRNRWSSYDLHGYNAMDGCQQTMAFNLECPTLLGHHRSQSDEMLQTIASTPPKKEQSEGFQSSNPNHSHPIKQQDVVERHAEQLQSIQSASSSSSSRSRSNKAVEIPQGQRSIVNGQRSNVTGQQTTTDGQLKEEKTPEQNTDKKTSFASIKLSNGQEVQQQQQQPTFETLELLKQKDKQIEKAFEDKRKTISRLFNVADVDLNSLLEKDVDHSSNGQNIRQTVLISLIQSDFLTSLISKCFDEHLRVAPEVASTQTSTSTDDKKCLTNSSIENDGRRSELSHSMNDVALRLRNQLKHLSTMINDDYDEVEKMKKDLDKIQQQIEIKEKSLKRKGDIEDGKSIDSIPKICIMYSEENEDKTHLEAVQGCGHENIIVAEESLKTRDDVGFKNKSSSLQSFLQRMPVDEQRNDEDSASPNKSGELVSFNDSQHSESFTSIDSVCLYKSGDSLSASAADGDAASENCDGFHAGVDAEELRHEDEDEDVDEKNKAAAAIVPKLECSSSGVASELSSDSTKPESYFENTIIAHEKDDELTLSAAAAALDSTGIDEERDLLGAETGIDADAPELCERKFSNLECIPEDDRASHCDLETEFVSEESVQVAVKEDDDEEEEEEEEDGCTRLIQLDGHVDCMTLTDRGSIEIKSADLSSIRLNVETEKSDAEKIIPLPDGRTDPNFVVTDEKADAENMIENNNEKESGSHVKLENDVSENSFEKEIERLMQVDFLAEIFVEKQIEDLVEDESTDNEEDKSFENAHLDVIEEREESEKLKNNKHVNQGDIPDKINELSDLCANGNIISKRSEEIE